MTDLSVARGNRPTSLTGALLINLLIVGVVRLAVLYVRANYVDGSDSLSWSIFVPLATGAIGATVN
jgi:hypothetical protein